MDCGDEQTALDSSVRDRLESAVGTLDASVPSLSGDMILARSVLDSV